MPTIPITNLSKGEIAPELQARIDTSQYGAGVRQMRNFIVQRYGGASFRPGFRYVAEADSTDTTPRYVPFQFNIEQAYVLVLDDGYMRLLANGGQVIEDNLAITALTNAANAQVTAAYHGYAIGDKIYFYGITGMTELNGQVGTVVSVIDPDNYTIDIDTTGYSTFVGSSGITRVGAPTPAPTPTPPPVPPTPAPPAETTDLGGSGSGLGEYERRYDDGTYR